MTTVRRLELRGLARAPSPVARAIAVLAAAGFALAFTASGALHALGGRPAAERAATGSPDPPVLGTAARQRGLSAVAALPALREVRHRRREPAAAAPIAVAPAPSPAALPVRTPAPAGTPLPTATPMPVRTPAATPAVPAAMPRPAATPPPAPSYVGRPFDSSG